MARQENPPFPRGGTGTFYSDPFTIDPGTNDNAGLALEGTEWVFEDKDFSQNGVAPDRTNRLVTCRVVRNKSGGVLLPKRVAKVKIDGTVAELAGGQVTGYLSTVGDKGYPIDEFLPAAGVVDGDLFYVVVKGPATVTSSSAGTTTLIVGQQAVADGLAAGKVVAQDTTATGANIYAQIQGAIGRAMTPVAAINTDFILDVGCV